ncbi:hypothetical protein LCGC14_3117830 [marine sediment metagenome]|uniref:Uncharacterized protein n=1 Tax=marine sediment metagenome TaxID=412755 RepID=A0A0F8W344_9ZZZZ
MSTLDTINAKLVEMANRRSKCCADPQGRNPMALLVNVAEVVNNDTARLLEALAIAVKVIDSECNMDVAINHIRDILIDGTEGKAE